MFSGIIVIVAIHWWRCRDSCRQGYITNTSGYNFRKGQVDPYERKYISSMRTTRLSLLLSLFSLLLANAIAQSAAPMNRIDLHNGWTVQTSRKVQATGDAIFRPKFQTKGWYRTSVPMTVVAVQVAAGEFPEPYYGIEYPKDSGDCCV